MLRLDQHRPSRHWQLFGLATLLIAAFGGHRAAQSQAPATPRAATQPIFVSGRQVEYQTRTIGGETYVPLSLLSGPLGFSVATKPKDQSLRIGQPGKPDSPKVVLIVGEDDGAVKLLADAGIAVTRKGQFPPTLDGYSAVWVTTTTGLRPSCRKLLADFINAGGGLVTSGDIPAAIAGTQFKERFDESYAADLSAITEWFGAKAILRDVGRFSGGEPNLPRMLFDRPIEMEVGKFPVAQAMALALDSRTARSLSSTKDGESFIYTNTHGEGRIYWQFARAGVRNYPDPPNLIPAAVQWVAKMK